MELNDRILRLWQWLEGFIHSLLPVITVVSKMGVVKKRFFFILILIMPVAIALNPTG